MTCFQNAPPLWGGQWRLIRIHQSFPFFLGQRRWHWVFHTISFTQQREQPVLQSAASRQVFLHLTDICKYCSPKAAMKKQQQLDGHSTKEGQRGNPLRWYQSVARTRQKSPTHCTHIPSLSFLIYGELIYTGAWWKLLIVVMPKWASTKSFFHGFDWKLTHTCLSINSHHNIH